MNIEPTIGRIARTQLGLITLAQLRDAHVSRRQLELRIAARSLVRVQPRVYAVAGAPESWNRRTLAALLSAGPEAIVSHSSAAALWGFHNSPKEAVEITVSPARHPRLKGVRVHFADVPPDDAREREGLRVVSIARTLVDISAFWSVGQLARALDEALRNHRTTLWAVEQCVRRLESGPNRRCSVIEMLVDERRQSIVVGDSRLEQLVYLPLVDAGVELPVPQFPVAVGGRRFRLDFAWPDAKLYVEVDGWDTHRTFTDFHGDRRRDALLVAAGWTPLHFTEASTSCDIVTMVTTTLARLRGIASALAPPAVSGF